MKDWHDKYGIGPWVVMRDEKPLSNAKYRGDKSEEVVISAAFAYQGDLQIELIELRKIVPTMYKEVLDRGQIDLQHYGVLAEGFEAANEFATSNGFVPVVESGIKGLAQMNYVEATDFTKNVFGPDEQAFMKTPEGHGVVLEIIQDNSMTKPYFSGMKEMIDGVPEGQLIKEFKLSDLSSMGVLLPALGKFLVKKLLGKV